MTRDEARQSAEAIARMLPGIDVLPADPRRFLLLSWDRRSVEMIRDLLLTQADDQGTVGYEAREIAATLEEWLRRADPYEDLGEVWPGLPM